LSILINYEID